MSEIAAENVAQVPEIVIEVTEAEQFKNQANEYFKSKWDIGRLTGALVNKFQPGTHASHTT